MSGLKDYSDVQEELDALEQAIREVCSVETRSTLRERYWEILESRRNLGRGDEQ